MSDTEADTFDLASLKDWRDRCESGVDLRILHPATKAATAMVFLVAAGDSERVRKTQRDISNSYLLADSAKRRTAEDAEREGRELVAARIVDWRGVSLNGQPLPCTPGNVREVLKSYPWIAEQVVAFSDQRASFLPA